MIHKMIRLLSIRRQWKYCIIFCNGNEVLGLCYFSLKVLKLNVCSCYFYAFSFGFVGVDITVFFAAMVPCSSVENQRISPVRRNNAMFLQ